MNSPTPNSPELADLAKTYPAPAARDLGADRHDVLRERFMTEILTNETQRPPVRRPVLRYLVPVVATAVAAAVAAGVLIGRQGDTTDQRTAAGKSHGLAVHLLADAATAAGHQGNPIVRDDQYEYTRTVSGGSGVPKQTREEWVPVANLCRGGMIRENGHQIAASVAGQAQIHVGPLPASRRAPVRLTCPEIGSVNDPTYRFLASLPTDPHALLARIYHDTRGERWSPDVEAFVIIGDLLVESAAPPAVTAALYRAAALIPGVTVGQNTTDAMGRHGVTVTMNAMGRSIEWIFDPAGGRLLGEREVLTRDGYDGRSGAVVADTAIVARTFVDKLGSTR